MNDKKVKANDNERIETFLMFVLKVLEEQNIEEYWDLSRKYRCEISRKFREIFPEANYRYLDEGIYYSQYGQIIDLDNNNYHVDQIYLRGPLDVWSNPDTLKIWYRDSKDDEYHKDLNISLCKRILKL